MQSMLGAVRLCLELEKLLTKLGRPVGVLFDLQGPSIRTGDVEEKIELNKGDLVEFRNPGAGGEPRKINDGKLPGLDVRCWRRGRFNRR